MTAKTKAFQWQKLTNRNIEGTIWGTLQDPNHGGDGASGQPIEFDAEELEAIFAKKATNAKAAEANGKQKVEPRELLDPGREKNVGIALQFLKLPLETIERSVRHFQELNLSDDNLEGLLSICPKPEELKKLEGYLAQAEPNAPPLSFPAQFFIMTMRVPQWQPRLRSWNAKRHFQSRVAETETAAGLISKAANCTLQSKNLPNILKSILSVGNYLNAGTAFRDAKGFRIADLGKVSSLRTTDNKSSMLEYLVDIVQRNNPKFHAFVTELQPLKYLASCDVNVVQEDMRNLRADLTVAASLVKSSDRDADPDVERVLGPFVLTALPEVERLESLIKAMFDTLSQFCAYFSENIKETPPQDLAKALFSFVSEYETERSRQEDRRIRAERMRQKQQGQQQGQGGEDEEGDGAFQQVSSQAFPHTPRGFRMPPTDRR